PNDQLRLFELSNLATSMRAHTVVTNDVLFHEPGRRILQDVVTCIRHNVTIDELGDRRERHADRYLKCWHPDVFCTALLNSQPMGFYAPAQIVRDAQAHGVEIRPVCANASRWDCTLELAGDDGRFAVRL